VQAAGEVEGPAPRRECGVQLCFILKNLLTKELKALHTTRPRFYQDKELNFTAELAQAAEHNDPELYVVSKILGARCNEREMFHELLVAWRGFPFGKVS
jgi:hypothetical protein